MRLKNQNGQAMAEAVILSALIMAGSLFLTAVFLNQMVSIAVDDAIETYFFCHIQKQPNCKNNFVINLKKLRLDQIQIVEKNIPPNYEIKLTANTSLKYELLRSRKMFFNQNISLF